jgi:hypothetical protein
MPFGSHAQAVLARSHGQAFIPFQRTRGSFAACLVGESEQLRGFRLHTLRGCCSVAWRSGNEN